MNVIINESWKNVLGEEFEKDYFARLRNFIHSEYRTKTIFPPAKLIFSAFDLCPFDKVKVVILGQDPYHEPNQAHGLSFSVLPPCPPPPSLVNIRKEIETDLGRPSACAGDLGYWASQGVLLLNSVLTVEQHRAGSHQNKGWEEFTDRAIERIAHLKRNVVFLLWGSYAQRKGSFIDETQHLVLKAPHPSPLSAYRGFFGCKHFSKANEYLIAHSLTPIDW